MGANKLMRPFTTSKGQPLPPLPIIPQPPVIYSGPAVPTAYYSNWQYFTNLTKEQVAWFRAQPEWADFLSAVSLSPTNAKAGMDANAINAILLRKPPLK